MKLHCLYVALVTSLIGSPSRLAAQPIPAKTIHLSAQAHKALSGQQILYIERSQYAPDHHNTATLFQPGEINQGSFAPGGAMRIFDVNSGQITTLIETTEGVIRDPDLSFDGKQVLFSMRKNKDDSYHIYEINLDGSGLRQITHAEGVSDIDPLYLPDGGLAFTSTRQPKYCMCNRHIMGNLYLMEPDGANITQIGVSTLFEGHASLLSDGRILYDRWEYVDRNFGDAQGLWTVNPDGTKHAVYYGNNTASPGGVIDARQIPGTDLIVCTFGSCHDRPWGAMAIIDRKKGVDGALPLVDIWPKSAKKLVGNGHLDSFREIENFYEDHFPVDQHYLLTSRTIWFKSDGGTIYDSKMGIYLVGRDGTEELIAEGAQSLFDPMLIRVRERPAGLPAMRNFTDPNGRFYVENVYEGTHMQGVTPGTVKFLRVVESPEKRTWTYQGWGGQGEQAPGMNWHSFENKQILGEVPVEEDGSVSFEVSAGKFVFFQLLDKDKKMVQSMRSGVTLMRGETNGCIGCHEDRLTIPVPMARRPLALNKKPAQLTLWQGKEPFKFSFAEHVQPILNRHCVKCHDFDLKDREKLVLAGDKNPFFNAAYINLYVNKAVTLIGGGSAEIQQPYSWGSHPSTLTKIIDKNHFGVTLSSAEKETMYTWMDLNGIYYPVYESAFDNTMAGRSPLTNEEMQELGELTGVAFGAINNHTRQMQAQIAFERPELSPCLDSIRADKEQYKRAVELIKRGKKRLEETPRGDIEKELIPCERHEVMLRKYAQRLKEEEANRISIVEKGKRYDAVSQ